MNLKNEQGVAVEAERNNASPVALVVGGGIAGIQAALDIADAGFKVYLVEREPSIGGRMAQLDKTFPTLDCSACILTPKMVDVDRHPNIELLTYSEVVDLQGQVGDFWVKVKKKPRYVHEEMCTGCGLCVEACVWKKVPSEFNAGVAVRSAAYIPFPQAVPLKAVIDEKTCLYLTRGKCGRKCEKACERGALDFEMKEESVDLRVAAIIVATGFDPFDPRLKPELGYGRYPNVITGLEFERLSSASGPTAGKITLNGKEPKDVVFIQCVGSRDQTVGNEYCSRVCCMYTAKQSHLVKERIHDANVTIFYMDVRAFGKGFEEFYDRVKREGVMYRRGSVSEIYKRGDRVVVRAEDTLLGEPLEMEADLVVLATGVVPRADVKDVAGLLNLERSPDGFFAEAHPKMRPVDTINDGIYLAGCCQGPKDIPDTVAQAKAAASSTIVILRQEKMKLQTRNPKLGTQRGVLDGS
ncbi:MAG: CoB--CoM heterodisulfide reductase iron-sulfur subunit A family protein [Anaerolineae bacterium]